MERNNAHVEVINDYFEAQNQSNGRGVAALFAADASVFNAAQPPVSGTAAILGFCENLYARTSSRTFRVIKIAGDDQTAMAEWSATMTFRAGAFIGPFTLERPFDVELRGVNSFEFKSGSKEIACLRVYHETTTVANLARANSKN